MRALIFHLGDDRYGLKVSDIVEVLPMLSLKRLPQTPAYIAGLMNYHGAPVPVVDLNQLGGGAPSRERFDTRVIVVDYRPRSDIDKRRLLFDGKLAGTHGGTRRSAYRS